MKSAIVFGSLLLLALYAFDNRHSDHCIEFNHNYKEIDDNFKLRVDGLYNTFDTTMMQCGERRNMHYKTYNSLLILNSDDIIYSYGGGSPDNSQLSIKFYSHLADFFNTIGSYSLKNDTLLASVPIELYTRGMRLKKFMAYFQGIVKNKDTIIDWHMVQPFPDVNPKFNNEFKDLTKPNVLYFIESKELAGLDSLHKIRRQKSDK